MGSVKQRHMKLRNWRQPKVKPWLKKKLAAVQQNSEAAQQKWVHHHLRVFNKVLKKAKTFEAGKIKRRLQQAKATGGQSASEAVEKLQGQLEAVKALDLDIVARQVAHKCGFPATSQPANNRFATPSTATAASQPTADQSQQAVQPIDLLAAPLKLSGWDDGDEVEALNAATGPEGASLQQIATNNQPQQQDGVAVAPADVLTGMAAVICQRLLRAGCVRKQMEESRQEFEKKFKQVLPKMARDDDPASNSDDDNAASDGQGARGDPDESDELADVDESDGQPGEAEPVEVTDAAALAALEKLRSHSKKRPRASDNPSESESDDDSGVIADLAQSDSDAAGQDGKSDESDIGEREDGEDGDSDFDSEEFDQPADGSDGDSDFNSEDFDAPAGTKNLPAAKQHAAKHAHTAQPAPTASRKRRQADSSDSEAISDEDGLDLEQWEHQVAQPGKKQKGGKQKPPAAKGPPAKSAKAAKKADAHADKKPKNRLGQRARRMLAEKMYGALAKHIAEPQAPRSKTGAHAGSPEPAPEHLHPSWQAKRKQKELLAAAAEAAATKKVKFDDDGDVAEVVAPAAGSPPAGDQSHADMDVRHANGKTAQGVKNGRSQDRGEGAPQQGPGRHGGKSWGNADRGHLKQSLHGREPLDRKGNALFKHKHDKQFNGTGKHQPKHASGPAGHPHDKGPTAVHTATGRNDRYGNNARLNNSHGGNKASFGQKGSQQGSRAAAAGSTAGAAAPAPAGALHPSWELRKQQRQQLKKVAAAGPQGTKVVFDD